MRAIVLGIAFILLLTPVVLADSAPILKDGVAPSWVRAGETATYRVTYSDEDGDAPAYVRLFLGSEQKDMTKVSGDFKTGAMYEYSWAPDKSLEYHFEASDGKTVVNYPSYGGTLAPVNVLTGLPDKNRIYLFSRAGGGPLWSYYTGADWVQKVAISADGSYIAAKTSKNVYLFSKASNSTVWNYPCVSEGGFVDLSGDGKYIVAGCQNSLVLFSRESSTPLWAYGASGSIYTNYISYDGNYIAAGTMESDELLLFSRTSKEPTWTYKAGGDIHGLAISADGSYVAAGAHCPDRRALLFSRNSNNPLVSYVASEGSPVWTADISSDGSYAVYGLDSAGSYKSILLFSPGKNSPIRTWVTDWWVRSVGMSSDGKYIVAGSGDHKVYFIDREKDNPVWKFEAGERVGSVSISSDGNFIAAGSKDKNVYLFSKGSSSPVWGYDAGVWVNTVEISADGNYIVAGTGAPQYLSEGSHSVYNPTTAAGTTGTTIAATVTTAGSSECGNSICEPGGGESEQGCPRDCVPNYSGEEQSTTTTVETGREELRRCGSFIDKVLNFFYSLFGKRVCS